MRAARRVTICLAVGVLIPALAAAQLPDQYRVVEGAQLPDSLFETHADGRFTISIARGAPTTELRALIAYAESLFPSPEQIKEDEDRLVSSRTGRAYAIGFAWAREIPGDRWWWFPWGETLLPYALTGRSVEHYIQRVRDLAAGDGQP